MLSNSDHHRIALVERAASWVEDLSEQIMLPKETVSSENSFVANFSLKFGLQKLLSLIHGKDVRLGLEIVIYF